jgi:hypothetical protein
MQNIQISRKLFHLCIYLLEYTLVRKKSYNSKMKLITKQIQDQLNLISYFLELIILKEILLIIKSQFLIGYHFYLKLYNSNFNVQVKVITLFKEHTIQIYSL